MGFWQSRQQFWFWVVQLLVKDLRAKIGRRSLARRNPIFFSYLCSKVKHGWYVGKNKYKDGFYFRKTYQQNPFNFAKKLFEKYLVSFDGNLFFINKMNDRLIKIQNPFNVSKEEFEEEFEEKFKGLIVFSVMSIFH